MSIFFVHSNTNAQEIFNVLVSQMPGVVKGEGTHFEIVNSQYLNVILDSTEVIKLKIESVPEMITMTIEPSSSTQSTLTRITIGGFNPLTTYYKYQDNYYNVTEFITDENGQYSYIQDLSKPHLVFIQPRKSTKFIKDNATGGDCVSIGSWDAVTKTCTLTTDVYETIQIDSNNITLDGNDHVLTGSNTGFGVFIYYKTGVTVKNLKIENFSYGIYLFYSAGNIIKNNEISNASRGIYITGYQANTSFINNSISNSEIGLMISGSSGNTFINNKMSGNTYGIEIIGNSDDDFDNNFDITNTIDDKPIYYIKNAVNQTFDETTNASVFYCIVCEGVTIKNLTVGKSYDGIYLWKTTNSKIENISSSNNIYGIHLGQSNNNIITNSYISHNDAGIFMEYYSTNNIVKDNTFFENYNGFTIYDDSSNNQFYNNNFLNINSPQGKDLVKNNVFNLDKPIGGNYWSDFDEPAEGCYDLNNDNFCDSPYIFYSGQDNYPWIKQDGWKKAETFQEFWVEMGRDGECIYQDEGLTTKLKCFPQGWILKALNPENKSWNDLPSLIQIEDATDGLQGWAKKEWLNYELNKQIEWQKRVETLDPSKNPNEGGTVPIILDAVNHYYHDTNNTPSLYSSNDSGNYISILKEKSFPIELILAIAAQESGESLFNFNNELMTYDYGHGIMQITLKGIKLDIKYLQIILNSDTETQVAKFGPGSLGNETHDFDDRTENAVKRFQIKYGIPVTGMVGPLTRAKLNEILENNRGVFLNKGIPLYFKFEDFLRKGFSDVIEGKATFDPRGIGSRLKIPPCADILNPDSQNYYKNCYRYYGGKEYKEYEPHQYYNNQVFKYYTNTLQGIYANIKDGLKILQWSYMDSLSKNKDSIDIIQWAGAVWRYNHGVQRRVIEKGDDYLARIANKLEFDSNIFDTLEEYFGDYKNKISNNQFLDEVKRKAVIEKFKNYKTGEIKSPAELRVYDSQGRVTGLVEGEIKNEIPDSDFYNNAFIIYTPSDSYYYRVIGTEEGDYGLTLSSIENGKITSFNAENIPISTNTIHQYQIDWQKLSQGENGVNVKIDLEGDGVFDQTITSGKEFRIEKTNIKYEGDASGFFSDKINLKAILTDEKGDGIPNKEIVFTLGNQTATSTTNENGVATTTLEIKLIPKELIEIFPLKVIFAGDDNYLVSKTQTDFTLKSARWLKEDAVSELEKVKSSDKRIDKEIDRVIQYIQNSLDDNLWIDASHLVFFKKDCFDQKMLEFDPDKINFEEIFRSEPDNLETKGIFKGKCFDPKFGIRVFHEEYTAIKLMQKELKGRPGIPETLKNIFNQVIAKLVKADQILAKISIFDAKNIPVNNPKFKRIAEHQIKEAEAELEKGEKEIVKNKPDKAILRFARSWLHSQLVIKFANFNLKR